jgi:hypothetical protein
VGGAPLHPRYGIPPIQLFPRPRKNPIAEVNPIEEEWQPLKRAELRGQMFERESELAYPVVAALENQREPQDCTTQYVNIRTTYLAVIYLGFLCRTY